MKFKLKGCKTLLYAIGKNKLFGDTEYELDNIKLTEAQLESLKPVMILTQIKKEQPIETKEQENIVEINEEKPAYDNSPLVEPITKKKAKINRRK